MATAGGFDTREARQATDRIIARMTEYFSNAEASGLWERVGLWMAGAVRRMYALRGGQYGRPDWAPLSDSGRPRIGTDGAAHGVYTSGALPLFASGLYAGSFGHLFQTPRRMGWGSNHPLADKIPYGGWRAGKKPRYAMPDNMDADFLRELSTINNAWISEGVDQALRGN